jgi:hypothetical protein
MRTSTESAPRRARAAISRAASLARQRAVFSRRLTPESGNDSMRIEPLRLSRDTAVEGREARAAEGRGDLGGGPGDMKDWRAVFLENSASTRTEAGTSFSSLTTWGIGGPADLLSRPRSAEEAASVLERARTQGVPATVVGWGSNLLVSDRGVRGVVLRPSACFGPPVFFGGEVTGGPGIRLPAPGTARLGGSPASNSRRASPAASAVRWPSTQGPKGRRWLRWSPP